MKRLISHTSIKALIGSLLGVFIFGLSAQALIVDDLPAGFIVETVTSGFNLPVASRFSPDGEHIFVVEKGGVVKVAHIDDGSINPAPFITLPNVNDYNDRGLLDLAFDPNYIANHYVYLLYTYENNPADYTGSKVGQLLRVTADPTGEFALSGTEQVILGSIVSGSCMDYPEGSDCIPSDSESHTVGSIRFASDGALFVSVGDASSFNFADPLALRAQNLDSLAGKILRINADGTGIPTNPFFTGNPSDNRSKVWAYGFRNPYRFALQPGTDIPFVGDVGWSDIEEANVAVPGGNFGWPCYEGNGVQGGYQSFSICQDLYTSQSDIKPLYFYEHPPGASIIGGSFYIGSEYPVEYQNAFFVTDYARGEFGNLVVDASNQYVSGSINSFSKQIYSVVDITSGPNNDLYLTSIYPDEIIRLRYVTGNRPPTAEASVDPIAGSLPFTAQFTGSDSFDPDGDEITYLWDFGDSTTSTDVNPFHEYTTAGSYTVSLTVTDTGALESVDTLTLYPGETVPIATIDSPLPGVFYDAEEFINFSGSGTDAEDGVLSGPSLGWTVVTHHCPFNTCHTHPLLTTPGSSGSFVIPDHGDDTYFELILTVTDSAGLSDSTSINLEMNEVELTIDSVPQGISVVYGEKAQQTPFTVSAVVGGTRIIEAPIIQGGNIFTSWSDGGTAQHQITVPSSNTTYTANFTSVSSDAYFGEYFANKDLSGSPSLVREDIAIDFEWGDGGSPDVSLPVDDFSARWSRNISLEDGPYQFTVTADDGVRVFVDGVAIINEWHNQAPTTYSVEYAATAGPHDLRVEYYEDHYNAVAKFAYAPLVACSLNAAHVSVTDHSSGDAKWYFDEVSVTPGTEYEFSSYYKSNVETVLLVQLHKSDESFDYMWLGTRPAAIDWTKNEALFVIPADVTAATVFHLVNSVGELTVDGYRFVETGTNTNLILNASFETPGPSGWIQNSWGSNTSVFTHPVPGVLGRETFCSRYFTNKDLAGAPILVRDDASIDFDWGDGGSPDPLIQPDNFSAQWIRQDEFEDGTYRFTITADDGVRVFVDDVAIINEWHDQAATTYSAEIVLSPGVHEIRVEYYENGYAALVQFGYEKIEACTIRGAHVEISSYVGGDAKWRHSPVSVVGSAMYTYQDYYISDISSKIVAEVITDSGTVYMLIGSLPSSADWQLSSFEFEMPPNALEATVYHLIEEDGSLVIDRASLSSLESSINLIANSSFENSGPSGWTKNSWGDHTSTFTYPVLGQGVCEGEPIVYSSQSIIFDGVDDYVDVGVWDIEEDSFTIEALFTADAIGVDQKLISKHLTGTSWSLGVTAAGSLEFILSTDGVPSLLVGGTVVPGAQTHAAVSYDGSFMNLYQDGILVDSVAKIGVIDRNLDPVWIGAEPAILAIKAFDGTLDDVRVWNVVRTDVQIAGNIGSVLADDDRIGLIKYWQFIEGFGQDILDKSNSGHHGKFGSTDGGDDQDPSWSNGGPLVLTDLFAPTHVVTTSELQGDGSHMISMTVHNLGDEPGHVVINMEVYDFSDVLVAQLIRNGDTFQIGEERTFDFEWVAPGPGTYRVAVGLIRLNWTGLYEWVNDATTFDVTL